MYPALPLDYPARAATMPRRRPQARRILHALPVWLLLLLLLLPGSGCSVSHFSRNAEPSLEKPIEDFAKWERVRDSERSNPSFSMFGIAGSDAHTNASWLKMYRAVKNEPVAVQAEAVNNFFNAMPYRLDKDTRGVEDHWATPREFMETSGDCEDFAIAKYYALRYLGVPARDLRIAGVWNSERCEGHAVLILRLDGHSYVLDNLNKEILPRSAVSHYLPRYDVNEDSLWILP